jgi:hypothetical protein
MHLQPYVSQVQAQLTAAAALGDERTRATAEALSAAVDPALTLALIAALSAGADEITGALLDTPGSPTVSCRLDGDEVLIEVRSDEPVAELPADHGDASARISLRLSEKLKAEVESAARAEGVSVNTWLVRSAAASLRPGARPAHDSPRTSGHQHRISGWINS